MKYWRSVGFIFENEKWWLNLLIASVCFIVPIIGPIVYMGYLAMMIEKFHQTQEDAHYDIFNIDIVTDYIKRGVWPFLGSLILALVIVPFILFFNLLMIAGCIFSEHYHIEWLVPVSFIAMFALTMVVSLAISFFSVPVCVGCSLGGDLKSGFSWRYLSAFIKNCWVEIILSFLFLYFVAYAAGIAAMILALVTCGIGFFSIYPIAGLVMIMQWHLFWQLYELNLKRGGIAVELGGTDVGK